MVGMMQNRGLTLWMAILAGLQTLTAGSQLSGLVGEKVAGAATLVVAALMTATTAWIAAQPKPSHDPVRVTVPISMEVPHPGKVSSFLKEDENGR